MYTLRNRKSDTIYAAAKTLRQLSVSWAYLRLMYAYTSDEIVVLSPKGKEVEYNQVRDSLRDALWAKHDQNMNSADDLERARLEPLV